MSKVKIATEQDYNSFSKEAQDQGLDWNLVHQATDTIVHTKSNTDSNINTVRVTSYFEGIGPERLINEIYDKKNEKELGGLCEEWTILENLDEHNTISYFRLSAPVMFVSSRDFVVVRSVKMSSEECVVMLKSCLHDAKPEDSRYVRGETYVNGYHCIPHKNGSQLTYLTRSDLKGYIPSWMINFIATKVAPNLMDDLRRVIKKNLDK